MATTSAAEASSTPVTSATDSPQDSPYYLHHSDSSSTVLVSPLLNGDNYHSWSRSMRLALSVKNKIGFIDGSFPCPAQGSTVQQWLRINDVVVSWILNSSTKDISASLLYTDSAHEIWEDLKDRFQEDNDPRIFQLRRDLINITQGDLTVSTYFTKFKTIWQEMMEYRPKIVCSCGGLKELNAYFQREYILSFLMGLNASYAPTISQILLMDPLPPINKAFALVVQEEQEENLR